VTGERRRLGEEAAATSRAAEEARANLLDLKGRLAEYEASAAAALRQARQEEERAAGVRAAVKAEQEQLAAAKKELEVRGGVALLPLTAQELMRWCHLAAGKYILQMHSRWVVFCVCAHKAM
jgi:hypothetical protein